MIFAVLLSLILMPSSALRAADDTVDQSDTTAAIAAPAIQEEPAALAITTPIAAPTTAIADAPIPQPATHPTTAEQPAGATVHRTDLMSLATHVRLQELELIYRKRLQDRDALASERFEDEATRKALSNLIEQQINALETVLQKEAPDRYERVQDDYTAGRRRALWIGGSVVVLATAAGIAICSYDPDTGTWHTPTFAQGSTNLAHLRTFAQDKGRLLIAHFQ